MCDNLLLLPKDCIAEITSKIDIGSAWKSWLSVWEIISENKARLWWNN